MGTLTIRIPLYFVRHMEGLDVQGHSEHLKERPDIEGMLTAWVNDLGCCT